MVRAFMIAGVSAVALMLSTDSFAQQSQTGTAQGDSKATPHASTASLGYGTAPPPQQVHSIWWSIVPKYQQRHQTACVVINYNPNPVTVTFDVYSFFVCVDHNNPQCIAHEHTSVLLGSPQSYQPPSEQPIWGVDDGTQPAPQCSLLSWQ
jgi:hypothetical protein